MKEVENKQAFYNNGIYFNWKIHLMVPRIKLLKRSWKMVCFFRESGILQPSVIVTASGVKPVSYTHLDVYKRQFAGCVLGIVLGYIMCRAAASTDGFLRFTAKDIGTYRFVWQMLVYAVAAAVIMVLFITVPVWKKSKDAISERSRERISKKKPLWEKCFIDVILLALSAYLLYNYNKQKSTLAISVLELSLIHILQ